MPRRNYAAQSDPTRNPGFRRLWQEPVHIGKAAEQVVNLTARRSIKHWLHKAQNLDGDERETAFTVADDIREASSLEWGDVLDHQQVA